VERNDAELLEHCAEGSVSERRRLQAYAEGNLNWRAAFEAKYSWMSLAYKAAQRRSDWRETMTIEEAAARWARDSTLVLAQYCENQHVPPPATILDVGCSTGYSSRNLQRVAFPSARITGVDASPYFLAVAETEERCVVPASRPR
jgi:SAM-dependent methyltransferase